MGLEAEYVTAALIALSLLTNRLHGIEDETCNPYLEIY